MAIFDVPLRELRRRGTIKWRRWEPDVLPMFVAEMDAYLAPPIREALERALADGDTGYPELPAYQEAFADYADWKWGWQVAVADQLLATDVVTGMREAVLGCSEPGRRRRHQLARLPAVPARGDQHGTAAGRRAAGRRQARPGGAGGGVRREPAHGVPAVLTPQPQRHHPHRRRADARRGAGGPLRRGGRLRRDPRAAGRPRAHAVPGGARGGERADRDVGVEVVEPGGDQGRAHHRRPCVAEAAQPDDPRRRQLLRGARALGGAQRGARLGGGGGRGDRGQQAVLRRGAGDSGPGALVHAVGRHVPGVAGLRTAGPREPREALP